MFRMLLFAGATLLLAVFAGTAQAVVPSGPRLAVQMLNRDASSLRIETVGQAGEKRQVVVGGPRRMAKPLPMFGFAHSWSPDGTRLVFGAKIGRDTQLFSVSADGSRAHAIPGTKGAIAPVFAPDGRTVAFARGRHRAHIHVPKHGLPVISSYDSVTTWTIELDGDNPRRLTPWRNGLEILPSSFSPDGAVLAASRYDEGAKRIFDAIAVQTDGSGSTLLVPNASRPAFSPDGSRLAFIAYLPSTKPNLGRYGFYRGGLTVSRSDGTEPRMIARTSFMEQSPPSWDPSEERLAYTEEVSAMQINVDGTCRRRVLIGTAKILYFGPAWQPGPGREVGRIAC